MTADLVRVEAVSRTYGHGESAVEALRDVSLTVPEGSLFAIMGRSGAGKTTLLNLIGGLDRPTEGAVYVGDDDISTMHESARTKLRRNTIGFVFQSFSLLPLLTAAENVELPLRLSGIKAGLRRERVRDALEVVGLTARAKHRPYELSGGEQQRLSIARALAARPRLILADEPTGELDTANGAAILRLLKDAARWEGITIVLTTHDRAIDEYADAVREMRDGRLLEGNG